MGRRAKRGLLVRGSLVGLAAWSLVISLAGPGHAAGQRSVLDPSFGIHGRVITRFHSTTNAQAVAFGPGGTILVAGGSDVCTSCFANPTLVALLEALRKQADSGALLEGGWRP